MDLVAVTLRMLLAHSSVYVPTDLHHVLVHAIERKLPDLEASLYRHHSHHSRRNMRRLCASCPFQLVEVHYAGVYRVVSRSP